MHTLRDTPLNVRTIANDLYMRIFESFLSLMFDIWCLVARMNRLRFSSSCPAERCATNEWCLILSNGRPGICLGWPMRRQIWVQSIRPNDQCQNSPGLGHRQLYAKGNPLNDRAGCNWPIRGKCLENGPTRDKLILGPFVQSKNGHFCMFVDSCVWRIFDNIWLHNSEPFISMSVSIKIHNLCQCYTYRNITCAL